MTYLVAALAVVGLATGADTSPLRQRIVSTTTITMEHVIVGRASCGTSTWLLTDAPALVEVAAVGAAGLTTPVRGFARDEHPWGLACVAHDELWTLANYRTLARVSRSGDVILRTKLRQPRLNVFGAGELLLLQPPTAPNLPLLSAARPVDINRTQPWPGVTTMTGGSKKTDLPSGLVACGLPFQMRLPCWITTQTRITISDGAPMRTSVVLPNFLDDTAHDPTTPVWDVAVAPSVLWILTSAVSGEAGRRVAARITRTNSRGERLGAMQLEPRGRLILAASDRAATVLTAAGTVVEVVAP
jgi:hypothetical protein